MCYELLCKRPWSGIGALSRSLSMAMMLSVVATASATSYIVTNTNNSGAGSLRRAITNANNNSGADSIAFSIPGTGVKSIVLTSLLPTITGPLVIDGFTQPGAVPNSLRGGSNAVMLIEISGNNSLAVGLDVNAQQCTFRGLVLNRFTDRAIDLNPGADEALVEGCYLGLNPAGTAAVGTGNKILLRASDAFIGQRREESTNFFSGNMTSAAIHISGVAAMNNHIHFNHIGYDAGANVIGGNQYGILLDGGCSENYLGEVGTAENYIAGCTSSAIVVTGATTHDNDIRSNSFRDNGGLAIDLGNDGVTLNDPGDGDAGPHSLINFPVIEEAYTDEGGQVYTRIRYDAPPKAYRIDFYASSTPDPTNHGEGHTWIGARHVEPGGGTNVFHITAGLWIDHPIGTYITCTATDEADHGTSEMSLAYAAPYGRLTVTNNTEVVNGNTNSVIDLINTPGADGISLREAIMATNQTVSAWTPDWIYFNIPGPSVQVISLTSPLPPIIDGDLGIDGATQQGHNGLHPSIHIDGSGAGAGANGLEVYEEWSFFYDLCFTGFDGDAIQLNGSNGDVNGCHLGISPDGTTCIGNNGAGIRINDGRGWQIGYGWPGPHNVISGNAGGGIVLDGSNTQRNVIRRSRLGVDITGNSSCGTQPIGIELRNGAHDNEIGAKDRDYGNQIAGHTSHGISGDGASNSVENNLIGTNANGTATIANAGSGIHCTGNNWLMINNVIGGNAGSGISISGSGANNNRITLNYIGTNRTGTGALADRDGITISSGATNNVIGPGNVISGNTQAGIAIAANNNQVIGNFIGLNANGSAALPNGWQGVLINAASGVEVGNGTVVGRNIISGNLSDGIRIQNSASRANSIKGNYVGTDQGGTLRVGNVQSGIRLISSDANRIGGPSSGDRNVISANGEHGIRIGIGSDSTLIQNNYIGLNTSGTDTLGNGTDGMNVESAHNLIGGTTSGTGNVVGGNKNHGICLTGSASSSNNVQGNIIGLDASGAATAPNLQHGMVARSGASNNLIGGNTAGHRNIISGNVRDGVWVVSTGTNNINIQGNYIGTDITGTQDLGNGDQGVNVELRSTDCLIGGDQPGEGNVISGNNDEGIEIDDENTARITVQGNIIGLDATGTNALENRDEGIILRGGASDVLIGGTTPGARNIISGNGRDGISTLVGGINGLVIKGNFIGTDITGTLDLGNESDGIDLRDNSGATVGGSDPAERNIISGHATGIRLSTNSINNTIQGNYIGTDTSGTLNIKNTTGIVIENGATDNSIGGTGAGDGNLIWFHQNKGVMVVGPTSVDNSILGNSIFQSGGLGIDLDANGPAPNDAMDPDAGPNHLQNYPLISSLINSGGSTTIEGTLNSTANADFRIEFFWNSAADVSGHGEGESYLGFVDVTTDANGDASFNKIFTGVNVGEFISTTATLVVGGDPKSTSEFSTSAEVLIPEDCNNGVDDDGDGLVDCEDPDCPAINSMVGTLDSWHYFPPSYARDGLGSGSLNKHYLLLSTPEADPIDVYMRNGDGTISDTVTIDRNNSATIELSDTPYGTSGHGAWGIVDQAACNTTTSDQTMILQGQRPFYANIRHWSSIQGVSITGKGTVALGTRFRSGHLHSVRSQLGAKAHFISVMAIQDGTIVQFSDLPTSGYTYINGAPPSSVTLDQYESFTIAVGFNDIVDDVNDLVGTLLTANKKIVTNTGSWLGGAAGGGNRDIGIDQLLPTDQNGTRFITVKGDAVSNADVLEVPMVIADHDSTMIFLNGSTTAFDTIDAGEVSFIPGTNYSASNTMYITTSEPVSLFQSTSSNNNTAPGLNFVPPLSPNLQLQEIILPNVGLLGNSKVGIITNTGASVTRNGAPIGVAPTAVVGATGYELYELDVSGTVDEIFNSDMPMYVFLRTRGGDRGAAGYFGGIKNSALVSELDSVCNIETSDTLCIAALDTTGIGVITYAWSTANGTATLAVQSGDTCAVIDWSTATVGSDTIIVTATAGCNVSRFAFPIYVKSCAEICDNGIDDDGDGLVDCEDPDCNLNGISYNWYFGQNAALSFENGSGPVQITPSSLNGEEGSAVWSSPTGDLMFYTNGVNAYDANHDLMPNGNGLGGHTSGTQSGVIVQHPGNADRFYVFGNSSGGSQVRYSVIDMTLNGGSGDVVPGQKNILLQNTQAEKLAAWPHANGTDIWLITADQNNLFAHRVTPTGIVAPLSSSVPSSSRIYGQMKFGPDGSQMVIANYPNSGMGQVQIVSFNNSTGSFSNLREWDHDQPYGVEFSPDGKLLYTTDMGWSQPSGALYQYVVDGMATGAQIKATETQLLTGNYMHSALQAGPDGKIYMATSHTGNNPRNGLAVINSPNVVGTGANAVADQITFTSGAMSRSGLPNFPYYQVNGEPTIGFVTANDTCLGSAQLIAFASGATGYQWLLNGNPIGGATSSTFMPTTIGEYQAVATFVCGSDTSDVIRFLADNDGDCVVDEYDLDDDNDGIPDSVELACSEEISDLNAPFWNYGTGNGADAMGKDTLNGVPFTLTFGLNSGSKIFTSTSKYTSNSTLGHGGNPGSLLIGGADPNGENGETLTLTFDSPVDVVVGMDHISTLPVNPDGWLFSPSADAIVSLGPDVELVGSSSIDGFHSGSDSWAVSSFRWADVTTITFTGIGNPNTTLGFNFIRVLCDTDNDGIADHLDLDSDNDGIYDLIEAGHGETDADNNGIIDGSPIAFGMNGLFDGVETVADNGVLNYAVSDSDSDGSIDSVELDSDGDLCNDVIEAGYTDHNDDGELGDVPLTVDGDGLVTSGGP